MPTTIRQRVQTIKSRKVDEKVRMSININDVIATELEVVLLALVSDNDFIGSCLGLLTHDVRNEQVRVCKHLTFKIYFENA